MRIATRGHGLTIAGPFSAGPYQVFDTADGGSVSFEDDSVECVLPHWWGAKGDDATDCTDALQAAFDTGLQVVLTGGAYRFSSTVDAGIAPGIRGVGRRRCALVYTGNTGDAIVLQGDHFTVEGFRLDGPGKTGNTANGLVLREDGSVGPKQVTVKDLRIRFFGGAGLLNDGFAIGGEGIFIEQCGVGIQEDGTGGHVSWTRGFINNCETRGVLFNGAVTHYALRSVNVELCPVGIFGGGSTAAPTVIVLEDCHFEGNGSHDVRLGVGTREATFIGGRLSGPNSRTAAAVEHAGSASTKCRLRFLGAFFVDEGLTANATAIEAGQNVEVIFDTPVLASLIGIDQSSLALGTDAFVTTPGSIGRLQTVGGTTNTVLDFADGGLVHVNLTGNITLELPLNIVPGRLYVVRFQQDGTGGRTVTLGAAWSGDLSINAAADSDTATLWYAPNEAKLIQLGNIQEA